MACSRPFRRPPELPPGIDLLEFLLSIPPDAREEMVRHLGIADADALDRDWPTWAHAGQRPPEKCDDGSDWSICVVMGGRGFGKTLAGAKWIVEAVAAGGKLDIALVGATLAEARRVMVEGRSGLIEVAGSWIRSWRPSLGVLEFRTGAKATLFSGASPEQLRGPEHHLAWCDELAKWEKAQDTWDMLQLGLRLGDRPRAIVTTTPRPGPVLTAIMAAPGTVVAGGPSRANPHASPAWLSAMHARYAGTRLGRQELEAELLTDTPGALWTVELLERCRLSPSPQRGEGRGEGVPTSPHGSPAAEPPLSISLPGGERGSFTRIVIGVDPPSGDGTCGIIVCAKDSQGIAHVLADHSVTARTPEGWSRAVADAARIHAYPRPFRGEGGLAEGEPGEGTSSSSFPGEGRGPAQNEKRALAFAGAQSIPVLIVAEQNQGGKMVQAVLHTADPSLKVKPVTATVGKAERAAPVAMLFEAGKVTLHGRFPELEAELCGMIAGGGYEGPGTSPDRADAMVWSLTELMLELEPALPRVRRL